MKKVILASNNAGKLQELSTILSTFELNLIPQTQLNIPPPEETGLSFIENAILKARHAAKLTDLPALADDSGLVVKALHGAPGIYSSRYSSENATDSENIERLVDNLKDIPSKHRQAYFYCVIAFVEHCNDPTPIIAHGRLDGVILESAIGSNGFGYDPVFLIPGLNMSAAQLPSSIKNKISHRAKALEQFAHLMKQSDYVDL
jgi:XTP/dITP diphosphohydrolase